MSVRIPGEALGHENWTMNLRNCELLESSSKYSAMRLLKQAIKSPVLIFFVALATRMIAVAQILRNIGLERFYGANEPSHIAASLAAGMGFSGPYEGAPILPTAQQPPVYPVILAGIFKLFGPYTLASAWAALSLNALAGAATAVLILFVGRRYFGETAALLSAWCWTLWVYEVCIGAAVISNFCIAGAAFLVFVLAFEKARRLEKGWMLAGIIAGVIALLQTTFLLIFAVCAGWLLVRRPRAFAQFALGITLCVVPWIVRDYVVLRHLVPVRDNFGLELWVGNRPGMQDTKDFSGEFPDHDPTMYAQMGEVKFMRTKQDESLLFIKQQPRAFVVRVFARIKEFWTQPQLVWAVLSLGALIGTGLAWKDAWLLGVTMLGFPLVYYLTHVWVLYRHPMEPVMILLFFAAFTRLIRRSPADTLEGHAH